MEDKVIFFDLFDTLAKVNRGYLEEYFDKNIDFLCDKGKLKNERMTIDEIIKSRPDSLKEHTRDEMIQDYENIMSNILLNIDKNILSMLNNLKKEGYKLCIISDAGFVDVKSYKDSPLSKYFNNAIFSCYYGYTKPDEKIYMIAKKIMGNPTNSFYIGDGGHDELIGAKRLNMTTIKAEWFKVNKTNECIDFSANTPNDIIKIIKKLK